MSSPQPWVGPLSHRVQQLAPSATLHVSQRAAALRAQGHTVVDLGAGEPGLPTPACIVQAARDALNRDDIGRYTPVAGIPSLREAACVKFARDQKLTYDSQHILVTPGAKAALALALEALVNPGDEVILFAPYWTSYSALIRLAGGTPVIVPTRAQEDYLPRMEAVRQALSPKTKAILLNSPSNPAGAVWPQERLQELVQLSARQAVWLISDEIYGRIVFDAAEHTSPASLSRDAWERTIVIDGVSKTHAMTGWRIGLAAGPANVITAMTKLQSQRFTCATAVAQHAAAFALREPPPVADAIKKMTHAYQQRRDAVTRWAATLPRVTCHKPQGAFYLLLDCSAYIGRSIGGIPIDNDITLANALLEQARVAAVPGTVFGQPGTLRLSFAAPDHELQQGMERIEEWLRRKTL
ncbi:MAG: pyridoxal phosphate-dependent aminotransferase [Myxococcota bacterium]